jgi:hypothetical protein
MVSWPRRPAPQKKLPDFEYAEPDMPMQKLLQEVDEALAEHVQADYAKPTARPRDINEIANQIDQCDDQERRLLQTLDETRARRADLAMHLAEMCDQLTDTALAMKQRYTGGPDANDPGSAVAAISHTHGGSSGDVPDSGAGTERAPDSAPQLSNSK